jgi:hypothetical protein
MSELEDAARETLEEASRHDPKLTSMVAVLVAITATCMAIGQIKDDNLKQRMEHAQSKSVDTWSFYQSKSTKQLMAENMGEQIRLQLLAIPGLKDDARARLETKAAHYESESRRYEKEKEEIKKQAEEFEKEHETLNNFDDEFDVSQACLTISIALSGITALTRKRWLLNFALVLSACGIFMLTAGFLGVDVHPQWLARLLG